MVPNQSENGGHNLILVDLTRIKSRFIGGGYLHLQVGATRAVVVGQHEDHVHDEADQEQVVLAVGEDVGAGGGEEWGIIETII